MQGVRNHDVCSVELVATQMFATVRQLLSNGVHAKMGAGLHFFNSVFAGIIAKYATVIDDLSDRSCECSLGKPAPLEERGVVFCAG